MRVRALLAATIILALLAVPAALPLNGLVKALAERQTVHHYKWTIMVYMDADNNLEDAGISDFNEMEVAGSTQDVAILVLMDRIPGYDSTNGNWTDARIYLVQHDTDNQTIHSKLLVDLGEVDMGDPSTVLYFVNYTIHNFPADHYALIFWDHGNGWKRSGHAMPVRGCCWDYTDNDHLTETELRSVMEKLSSMGVHLDIVGFDACLMQMTEVAYDLMGTASIVVASEEYEPWDGWYYSGFLVPLILNPDMTPAQLAAKIVESYEYYYTKVEPLDWVTLSAINLTSFQNVIRDVDSMAMLLTYDVFFYPNNATAVHKAWSEAKKFGSGDYMDLYGFAEAINSTQGFPYDPRPAASRLLSDLNASVVANYAGPSSAGGHGITIYFPPDVDWYLEERYEYFEQVAFAVDTWWGIFLDYYFHTMKPTEHLKVKVVAPPMVSPGSNVTVYILTSYGKADIYVDELDVSLIGPNGYAEAAGAQPVEPGVYVATIHVPAANSSQTYMVRARAYYWFLAADDGAVLYASRELATIPQISSSLATLRAIVEEYGAVLENVSNGVAIIKTVLGEVNVSIGQLKPEIIKIENGVAVLNTSIGEVKASLDSLKPEIVDIKDNVAVVKTRLGEVKATLDSLKPVIESIRGDVATIKTVLGEVNVSVAQLKPRIVKIENGIATVQTTLGSLSGEVKALEGDFAVVKTSLGVINASLADIKTSQKENFNSVNQKISSIHSRLSTLEANMSSLNSKLNSQAKLLDATLALVVIVLITAVIAAYGALRKPSP